MVDISFYLIFILISLLLQLDMTIMSGGDLITAGYAASQYVRLKYDYKCWVIHLF